ncbi:MAG TPA: hypothetical protein VGH73_04795 [Thermoanaerobaculia bacterium]|jgi:hypothetical protein
MPSASFAKTIAEWEKLLATVAANKDDLQAIDAYRAQLEVEVAGAKAANVRQSTVQAEVQQATRDLEGFFTRGRDLATRIRTGIQSKYGLHGEKLTEFGMKVRRKRKAATPKVTKPKQTPPPQTAEKPAPQEVPTTK